MLHLMKIEPSFFPAARPLVNLRVLEAPPQSPVGRFSFRSNQLARDETGELRWIYIGGDGGEWSSQGIERVNGNMWDNPFNVGSVRNFSGMKRWDMPSWG